MPEGYKFACPHCGQHLEAEPDMAGLEVECPRCGRALTVPPCPMPVPVVLPPSIDSDGIPTQPPVIQIVSSGKNKTADTSPVITVVKGESTFFLRNKRWLVPVACVVALLAVVGAVVMLKSHSRKRRPGRSDSYAATSPSYAPPAYSSPRSSRQFVRDHIENNANCRIVSITKVGGDVVVSGRNNWAANNCPRRLTEKLQEIADDDDLIIDVCLTELGRYIVLYARNAASWNGIPSEMEYALRQYNANDEELYSATFNDAGDWIVVSDQHYSCSATWLKQWLADGASKYGILRAAAVSTDAAVAVYDGGYKFFGNIPDDLKSELKDTFLDVRIIKIAGRAWFFADKTGYGYHYHM